MSQLTTDLATLGHSTSHVLAQAVLKKYPNAKLGIGPAIDDGFYYDFDLEVSLTDSDSVLLFTNKLLSHDSFVTFLASTILAVSLSF